MEPVGAVGFLLRAATLAAAVWAVSGLAFLWLRARAYGKREIFAAPAGSALGGVIYAFTRGMLPWAKESVRERLPSFLLGLAFHLGIFSAIALLAAHLLGLPYPPFGDGAGAFLCINRTDDVTVGVRLIPLLLALGAVGGASLFAKRLADSVLRGLSCPDDYVSNILATAFVVLALASALLGRPLPSFFVSAVALLLYLPLGKMRHCLFFFSTRCHFGAFFGRRGCMPPAAKTAGLRRFGA
jgi:hypothetical protein